MVREEAEALRPPPPVRRLGGEDRRARVQSAAAEGLRAEPQKTVLQTARPAETESPGEEAEAETQRVNSNFCSQRAVRKHPFMFFIFALLEFSELTQRDNDHISDQNKQENVSFFHFFMLCIYKLNLALETRGTF